jgi:L-2-hydroxyglutarate oxidase LhgO
MDQADCIVVGAGVIGLSIARELALRGRDVVIVEAAAVIGSETSSRNNEVIHAGFLYPSGSLKASLCRRGADALYRYCRQRQIPHRQIGKLVISTSDTDTEVLRRFAADAPRHGVEELRFMDGMEARKLEPQLHCRAAIFSPFTGVVDTHALMLALLADAEQTGAMIAYDTCITAVKVDREKIVALTNAGGREYAISCRTLVNAAGLGAAQIARSCHGNPVPEIDLAKGNFFALCGRLPFQHLVVPVGETLAMGGAFTIDSAGQGKFGPDLEWVDHIDYCVDEGRRSRFAVVLHLQPRRGRCIRPPCLCGRRNCSTGGDVWTGRQLSDYPLKSSTAASGLSDVRPWGNETAARLRRRRWGSDCLLRGCGKGRYIRVRRAGCL